MKKKMLLFAVIIIVLSTAATSYFSYINSKESFFNETISKLKGYCNITNQFIETDLDQDVTLDYQKYADYFSQNIDARITIIDKNGEVIGDSQAKNIKGMENHKYREEVKSALETGLGVSVRKSSTIGVDFMYVATPFYDDGQLAGITRVGFQINEINSFFSSMTSTSIMTFILVAFVTLLIGYAYAVKITNPIVKITEIAKSIADGNYNKKIYVNSKDEIQELATTINYMAESLASSMDVLEASNSKLSSILLSMTEGIVAVDMDYKIILYNGVAAKLFGLNENAINKHLLQSIRNIQLYGVFQEIIDNDFVGEKEIAYSEDKIIKIKSGHIVGERDKKIIGVLALMEDITKINKLETMRRDFVANVSHELNTPLTSISGFVETLQDGAAQDPQLRTKFLGIIAAETNRLRVLIQDLLVLSDIERGKVNEEKSEIDINGELKRIAGLLESKAIDRQVKIDFALSTKRIMFESMSGPGVFQQLALNLMENGVKYSKPGGTITVSSEKTEDGFSFTVKDDGIGIDEKYRDRIFERFYRVDSSRSQKIEGTGLGLAIVKHIVQVYGGTIQVESKPDEGSTFVVSIPQVRG